MRAPHVPCTINTRNGGPEGCLGSKGRMGLRGVAWGGYCQMAWSSSLAKNYKLLLGRRARMPDHVSWHAHRCTLITNMAYGSETGGGKGSWPGGGRGGWGQSLTELRATGVGALEILSLAQLKQNNKKLATQLRRESVSTLSLVFWIFLSFCTAFPGPRKYAQIFWQSKYLSACVPSWPLALLHPKAKWYDLTGGAMAILHNVYEYHLHAKHGVRAICQFWARNSKSKLFAQPY